MIDLKELTEQEENKNIDTVTEIRLD